MPSKSPSSRSHRFNIHCSKDELDKLSLAANQANLSLSRYLIESGLSFSANSLSPFIRDNIEQIKFESALLQHHLDLLLNKKSYIEQLASLGELNNLISFLSFSAKSLHDIFLADSNQNKINQFISNHNEINHNYSSNCSNCSNCHQLNNALLNNNSLINEQLNHQQLNHQQLNHQQLNHQQLNHQQLNQLSDNQLNATSSINHLLINNQLNSHQPNSDLSISQQLINCPLNNQQLDNSQLHNNPLNDDLLNNNQIVTSNCSCDSLSNDSLSNDSLSNDSLSNDSLSNNILSNNNSDISHNSNSDHSANDNSDNKNAFNLFIASGISDNKANKPTISFFCNSIIALVVLNNSFSTYSPISLISYYFYLDEIIPISFVFLSSSYPVFINQSPTAQILEAPLNQCSVVDCPIVDTPVFEIPFIEIPVTHCPIAQAPVMFQSEMEVEGRT